MHTRILVIGACLSLYFAAGGNAQEVSEETKPAENGSSIWMKKKMEYSRNLLEGIATGDFDLIADNARAMKGLSKVEAFVRGRSANYRTHLQAFEAATDELIRQADKSNLDGSLTAFNKITSSCVKCHKHLREDTK